MNSFFKKKQSIFFFICCAIVFFALIFAYGKLALQEVPSISKTKPYVERGLIVDRYGAPLAVPTNTYHIGVTVKDIKNKKSFSEKIAVPLGMDKSEVAEIINSSRNFVYLKKKVSQEVYEAVKDVTSEYNYNFVTFEKIPSRHYPNHSLASQLIGYMGSDEKGLAGIEFAQQDILQPVFDANENTENANDNKKDGKNHLLENPSGKNVYLTIDANLQYKLEQVAHATMAKTGAESMMLIAADSKSGEILSYVSLPSYDLNDYGNSPTETKIDRPAMVAYEPGSVFKIFTVGIVHDSGSISPNTSFLCDGMYEKRTSGETVRIKCLEHHGWGTPRDGLKYSCNDILCQISDYIDEETFISRIRSLGFGIKTGIELPSETSGSVKDTKNRLWSARSKPTIAIGQEISVSALQMVQAATAIANGGVPVKLSVIKKITNKDGSVYSVHEPEYKERVFSKSTADYVLSCMETTAKEGTGSRANISDVSIGVKTGTAQMADKEKGGYSDTDFLSSCIAIFPIADPQIVLYIVVEKAKGETYGGRIVAPVIGETADIIIDHLGMSRGGAESLEHSGLITIPKSDDIRLNKTVPNFIGKSKKDLLPLLELNNIQFTINGSGWVTSQSPEPGTPLTENMTIELNLE